MLQALREAERVAGIRRRGSRGTDGRTAWATQRATGVRANFDWVEFDRSGLSSRGTCQSEVSAEVRTDAKVV